jgi:predicted dehydrogenase
LPAETVTRTFDPVNLYGKELEDFIGVLKGQTSVGTTLQDACHALPILEAITESYSTGRSIALDIRVPIHGQ